MIKLVGDTIDRKDIDKLIEWLKTYPHLTKGDVTKEYESRWSKVIGTNHSVFVNSGSSALLLMLYTLMEMNYLKKGDGVVLSDLSWSTDLSSIIQIGLQPILCDCNLENLSFDLNQLNRIVEEKKPKAILLVSVLGLVPEMFEIKSICDKNDIVLLEDACESLGSTYRGKQIGSFGLMSVFSTYFGHHLSTIEGGIVSTSDKKIYNVLKSLRSHGWDRDMDDEEIDNLRNIYKIDDFNALYTFYYCGFNFRSTDLQAFLGLEQLKKKDMVIKKRNENYLLYKSKLSDKFWKPMDDDNYISNFAYPMIVPNREKIINVLNKNGIENRPLICGSISKQPFWTKKYGVKYWYELKNSEYIHDHGFYLPNNFDITKKEIKFICDIINEIIL